MIGRIVNIFKIRVLHSSIHSGFGFAMGDGMDIEGAVLAFGKNRGRLSGPGKSMRACGARSGFAGDSLWRMGRMEGYRVRVVGRRAHRLLNPTGRIKFL